MDAPETCPYKVRVGENEAECFDPRFVASFPRDEEIVRNYCCRDYRSCPYYLIHSKQGGD